MVHPLHDVSAQPQPEHVDGSTMDIERDKHGIFALNQYGLGLYLETACKFRNPIKRGWEGGVRIPDEAGTSKPELAERLNPLRTTGKIRLVWKRPDSYRGEAQTRPP